MTEAVYDKQMMRLERLFNRGINIGIEIREEYWCAFKFVEDEVFKEAVDFLISSFKPYPSEPFPSVASIESAVIDMKEDSMAELYEPERTAEPPDYSALDFCQKCENSGLFLAADDNAHFCGCEKGRLKRASWNVEPAHTNWEKKKREEKILQNLSRLPPSAGPVRGIKEWNPNIGAWEDTQAEHDRWCAAKRKQIKEIKKRELERRDRKAINDISRLVEKTIEDIKTIRAREPGEDDAL